MKKRLVLFLLLYCVLCCSTAAIAQSLKALTYDSLVIDYIYEIGPGKMRVIFSPYKTNPESNKPTLYHYSKISLQNGYKYFTVIEETSAEECIINAGGPRQSCVASATIQCFRTKPKSGGQVYDATSILDELNKKT